MTIQQLVNDFIKMNQAGKVLELCEKHYDDNVQMLSNGDTFASSRQEAMDKQAKFVAAVQKFEINLLSEQVNNDVSELIFDYKMTTENGEKNEFIGKHILSWKNQKIIKEEFSIIQSSQIKVHQNIN